MENTIKLTKEQVIDCWPQTKRHYLTDEFCNHINSALEILAEGGKNE